jgi:3-isopropylmalate/(R)-2-methylmalate dehydratase small subunit
MEPLITLTSIVAPLLRDNIDTDAVIPASYMRSLATNPGDGLFARWRYRADGSEEPSFVLNSPRFRTARILLAGENFGCGSSRENAVWALDRFGIRCVIALGFSDIFRENAFKNGLLPLALPKSVHAMLTAAAMAGDLTLLIDVGKKQIVMTTGETFDFELDPRRQTNLLEGTDEIAQTLRLHEQIAAFRDRHRMRAPWLYPAPDTQQGPATTR